MLEILAMSYFIKQIKKITEEKGIKSGKWIGILVAAWFATEILVFVIGMVFFGFDEDDLLFLMIPAIALAAGSAFLVLNKVKSLNNEVELELDEFATKDSDEKFDHFR